MGYLKYYEVRARKKILSKAVGFLIFILISPNLWSEEGSITFRTYAPPPTEDEKKIAKEIWAKAEAARERLQKLSAVLRVLGKLQNTVETVNDRGVEESISVTERLNSWSAVGKTANSLDELKAFIYDSLTTAEHLESLPTYENDSKFDFSSTRTQLKEIISRYQSMFDESVVEHGTANQTFRYYPFNILEKQPFVDCNLINEYSRDFRCDKRKISDESFLSKWCKTEDVENFSRELYPEKQIWVLKGSTVKPKLVNAKCSG